MPPLMAPIPPIGGMRELAELVGRSMADEQKHAAEAAAAAAAPPFSELCRHLDGIRSVVSGEMKLIEAARVQLVQERRKLDQEWRLLEAERKVLKEHAERLSVAAASGGGAEVGPPPPPVGRGGVVQLNVGGTRFTTTIATLCAEPGSGLAALFRDPGRIPRDHEGRLFLDCDPAPFEVLLKYLRGERFAVKRSDPLLTVVRQQAEMFGLLGFSRLLDAALGQGPTPQHPPSPRAPEAGAVAEGSPGARSPRWSSPRGSPAAASPDKGEKADGQQQQQQQQRGSVVLQSPARFLADSSLHAPLERALERQRRREQQAATAAMSAHVVGQLQQDHLKEMWAHHWGSLLGDREATPAGLSV
eukprot:Hpha_TRINITY_DN9152_c0_g1::TRINITY_DN9152_c0_g1_i1::g.94473::m.94473